MTSYIFRFLGGGDILTGGGKSQGACIKPCNKEHENDVLGGSEYLVVIIIHGTLFPVC